MHLPRGRLAVSVAIACAVVGIIIAIVSLTGFGLNMANDHPARSGEPDAYLGSHDDDLHGSGHAFHSRPISSPRAWPLHVDQARHSGSCSPPVRLLLCDVRQHHSPVALASFAAAGISGGDPMKTGLQSVKLSLAGFIVPYIFVYNTLSSCWTPRLLSL